MKRKVLAIIITTLMIVTLIPTFTFTSFAAEIEPKSWADKPSTVTGSGSKTDPYCIGTLADLEALAAKVNAGADFGFTYFKLTADIDNFTTPIGIVLDYREETFNTFNGFFDGDGHTVSLNINDTEKKLCWNVWSS